MPSARLLALAPAPGQQLFLRGATATAATSSGGSGTGGTDNTVRPGGWCRCSSALVSIPVSSSPFPSVALFHTRTAARRLVSSMRVASFGTATLPKQVAFPRHGKAVEPQVIGEHARDKLAHSAKAGKRPVRKTSRRIKNGASSKTKGDAVAATVVADAAVTPTVDAELEAEEEEAAESEAAAEETAMFEEEEAAAKEAAAEAEAADEAEAVEETQGEVEAEAEAVQEPPATPAGLDKASLAGGLPSVALDAQQELGRDVNSNSPTDAASPLAYTEKVVGLAADAAAAAATAATTAEPASVAAGIVNDSLVIELGPPNFAMGKIAGPRETDPSSPEQQQQRQQQERISLPASLRQPLSQKPPPPHLVPPPYVHHFDSYSLVRQLELGGYQQTQAITAMKGVRLLLAQNLDVAQSSLVSKSDVENEAYLFKAACAELSIEVRNNRRRADEQMRQQRTLLQSEVDIAAQSVNQELVALTDVVKGLFNDRKMAVREEQKALESAVQQLNYKITIMLNSEMRSEIEALRWVLIRRSVLGIIFMVMLTLGSLRYVSYVSHEKKNQADRAAREAREAEMQRYADTKFDSSSPPDAAEILAAN